MADIEKPPTTIVSRHLLLAGLAGGSLLGMLVGGLTLTLNSQIHERLGDSAVLLVYFVAFYGTLGLIAGALFAVLLGAVTRVAPRRAATLGLALVALLVLAPLAYFLLLPDVGLAGGSLSRLIYGGSWPVRLIAVAVAGLLLAGIGTGLRGLLRRAEAASGLRAGQVLTLLWALSLLSVGVWLTINAPRPASSVGNAGPAEPVVLQPASPPPPRVVLLCMDGADLDDMILPMVAAGELPTFAALMREGTWGELASLEPTLSPLLWTTIVTGMPPERHGIHHFVNYRLPGVDRSVFGFPRQTGLNFRLLPLLDRLPGPELLAPYTSNMRRVRALWNIVGEVYPAGSYRWLVTWPTEPINGFNVAGEVHLEQRRTESMGFMESQMRDGALHPVDLYRGLPPAPSHPVTEEKLRPYVGEGQPIDLDDPRLRSVADALDDPTAHYLPLLIEKYDTRFTAAAFYNVDVMAHHFSRHRDRGGIFSDAIAERYRVADARLGEFLDAIGPEAHVIVVSDHGFDFANHHHIYAPPGSFLARGPAFEPGRRVDGLALEDVAPLVLHLLGLPLAEDMPGTVSGNYRRALAGGFLDEHPAALIASYETTSEYSDRPVESDESEELKERLRGLGYIN